MAGIVRTTVDTNDDLRALANIVGPIVVRLKTLDSLRTAPEMYQTLHRLVRAANWTCPKLTILEGFSFLARKVESIRALLPPLLPAVMPNPVLEGAGSILYRISQIKREGDEVRHAQKVIKFRKGGLERQADKVGELLYEESGRILDGSMPLVEFQARIPIYLAEIDHLLNSRMDF
ncbi:hypothetical protein ACQJBY_034875 [Aegilops geniculata]